MVTDELGPIETPPAHEAVGIVVQDGGPGPTRPRAFAFVWGGRVRPRPSLPYGRWKAEVLPAA
jgi:hypothetical protein